MSEYADIKIGNMSVCSFRNYVAPDIVCKIFYEDNLCTIENYVEDPDDEDSGSITRYYYKTTVNKAKDRLDAQGYTLSRLENIFNDNMLRAIDYSSFLDHLRVDCDFQYDKAKERLKKYKITFKKWENSIKKITNYMYIHGNLYEEIKGLKESIGINTECDKIIYYSLLDDYAESFYSLDTEIIDKAYIIRLLLESFDVDEEIILDFTDLQFWDVDCVPKAIAATQDVEKTIVLVEGTSDKDILEFAISRLYPHLSDLFYFMDFGDNNGKRDGGTSFVAKNLKTFYFSKIKRNFIAIFDNDAEGYQCKSILLNDIKQWPDNFKILLYPDIDLFKKYPTIVPNGEIVLDNICKKAASIELYLPDSIIKNGNDYLPVEWESRKKIKINGKDEWIYQGVISKKETIKNKFYNLKNDILNNKCEFINEEWYRMKVLLETIVFAYR